MAGSNAARALPGARDVLAADVGQRIRAARTERGMTLAQLGGDDLSRSFLSLVETGRSRISLRALSIVAARLGLPVSYFLEGTAESAEVAEELSLDAAERAIQGQKPGEALQLLSGEVSPRRRWRALWLHGWALVNLGRAREAIPVLEDAVEASDENASPYDQARVVYVLARALYRTSAYQEARGQLSKALAIGQETGDAALLGMITICLGHIAYSLGDFDQALAAYDRARDLFATVRDPANLASVYAGLSRVYERSGNAEQALRYSRLSLGLFEQHHNERAAAQELAAVAERSLKLGQVEQAMQDARGAVALARQVNAPDVEALAHVALARASLAGADFAAAEAEAAAAEEQATDLSELTRGEIALVRAAVAEERGDREAMGRFYEDAIDRFKQISHGARLRESALAYSRKLRERGETEKALTYALLAAESQHAEAH